DRELEVALEGRDRAEPGAEILRHDGGAIERAVGHDGTGRAEGGGRVGHRLATVDDGEGGGINLVDAVVPIRNGEVGADGAGHIAGNPAAGGREVVGKYRGGTPRHRCIHRITGRGDGRSPAGENHQTCRNKTHADNSLTSGG